MSNGELKGYKKAREKKAVHNDALMSRPGVHGVYTGEKIKDGEKTGEASIVIVVEKKQDVPREERIPKRIDGVLTDVIEMQKMIPLATAYERYDPLEGGIGIGSNDVMNFGTMGIVLTDSTTGNPVGLSNWHVVHSNGSIQGESVHILQPPFYLGGYEPDDLVGLSIRSKVNTIVDASIFSIDTREVTSNVVGLGEITAAADPAVDDAVAKNGAMSGITYATVIAIDATVTVGYPEPIGDYIFNPVIHFQGEEGTLIAGDSGSALVRGDTLVGLCFAGVADGSIGTAALISNVFSEMEVELYHRKEGMVLTGEFVKGHADIISINHLETNDAVPDSWSIWGSFFLHAENSSFTIGVGHPSTPAEYPAYCATFPGAGASGGGVSFIINDPSGTSNVGSQSFRRNAEINFTLTWDAPSKTLSCEAMQGGSPDARGTRVVSGTPDFTEPYHAVIIGTRDGGGQAVSITKLQAARECGAESGGGGTGTPIAVPASLWSVVPDPGVSGSWTTAWTVTDGNASVDTTDSGGDQNGELLIEIPEDDAGYPVRTRFWGTLDVADASSIAGLILGQLYMTTLPGGVYSGSLDYSAGFFFEGLGLGCAPGSSYDYGSLVVLDSGGYADSNAPWEDVCLHSPKDFFVDWNPDTGTVTATYDGITDSLPWSPPSDPHYLSLFLGAYDSGVSCVWTFTNLLIQFGE